MKCKIITACLGALGGVTLLFSGLVTPAKAVITGENFIWGMNGHPESGNYSPTSGNYTALADTELSQLKAMGTPYYRIDLNVNTSGQVMESNGSTNGAAQLEWTALYNAAPSYGVKFLVMLYTPFNLSGTWTSNYNTGYSIANSFCEAYPQVLAIEEGNELDSPSAFPFCTGGTDDGASVGDYNAADCELLAGMLTGMYAGAHAATSSVVCAIDCINHDHWGWFMVLQNDGVPWDRTAIHWYSSSGSILNTNGANGLDKFSAFGKKIWFTETNNGGCSNSGGTSGDAAEITGMQAMLYDEYYYSNVEAIFSYELYDDPSGNYGMYANPTTSKPIVSSMTTWTASTTGPAALPIGQRIALKAYSGYYVTENSSNNDFVQANSATTIGLPQYFDVVDSLWQGYGVGQIALWCENTGYYVSADYDLSGQTDQDTLICDWEKGISNNESYNVEYVGNSSVAMQNVLTGYYVTCNLSDSDLLMAQYATTPGNWEFYGLTDVGIAPYNPYNTVTEFGANISGVDTGFNGELTAGEDIISPNGHAELAMQSDGNLVLYNIENASGWIAEWSSNTSGHSGAYMILQGDGNLVVYSSTGSALWSTATYSDTNAYLGLTSTGNLALYSQTGTEIWQTSTSF